jgi:hypothetical protein
MKHSVSHELGQDKARKVAQAAFESYRERFAKYRPEANWISEKRAEISFHVKGLTLNGAMEVNPSNIEMELDVPFVLRPFKGKALGIIEDEIRKWLHKAQAGEI